MNKRSLLNLAMCSLLLSSLPVGLVGCKDYDGDIKDLNTTTGDLSSQLSTLKTALEAANTAAANAASDAKAAADKADSATQEAALAKKAAEEAKAEALAEVIKQVEAAKTEMTAENAKELAALAGRIDGIEEGLNKIDMDKVNEAIGSLSATIAEANKQLEAIKVQMAALDKLQSDLGAVTGDVADLKTKVAAIETIKADLAKVQAQAAANATAIAANTTSIGEAKTEINNIKSQLTTLSSEISTKISNAVNGLAGLLKQRLTSVTLIPELYVNGVPSISFENGTYNKIEWKADKDMPSKGQYVYSMQKVNGVEDYVRGMVTNGAVEAKYRLNPATITANDIDLEGLGFFTQIAEFKTRAEQEKEVLKITGASVGTDGILTVQLTNPDPTNLREGLENSEDYTVSLRVPVAKNHLLEGEAKAEVYSEFARLREVNFNPTLGLSYQASNRGDWYNNDLFNGLYNASYLYSTYSKDNVVKNLVYDKTYDLNDLFIGRMSSNYRPDTIAYADLAKYDLAIKYSVAGGSYTPYDASNKVDQQQYVALSGENGHILTPQTPSGVTANQAIIGKAPILIAELYDVNNGNIIDAEYFKVMFSAQEAEDIKFTFDVKEYKGDACGISYDFTWEYMTKNLLEKLNDGKGMSQSEFRTLYNWPYSSSIPDSDITPAYISPSLGNSGWSTSSDVPAMTIYADENNLPALKTGDNPLVFGNILTIEAKVDGYPDIKVRINWTPTLKVTKASFGETLATTWVNNTMEIRVMPMEKVDGVVQTARYATNILTGRQDPYVKDLLGCATYSINIANKDLQDADLMKALNNYTGTLTIGSGFTNGTMSKANQEDLKEVTFILDNSNANAKTLASYGGTIRVDWTSNINGLAANNYLVGSTYLKVLPILQYANQSVATITPALNPVEATMSISFKDAYGSVVKPNTDLWTFYGISAAGVTYKQAGIKIGTGSQTVDQAEELANTPFGVTVSGNKITFSSNGASVQTESKIYVPFEVEHAWGVLKGYAVVTLKTTPK